MYFFRLRKKKGNAEICGTIVRIYISFFKIYQIRLKQRETEMDLKTGTNSSNEYEQEYEML